MDVEKNGAGLPELLLASAAERILRISVLPVPALSGAAAFLASGLSGLALGDLGAGGLAVGEGTRVGGIAGAIGAFTLGISLLVGFRFVGGGARLRRAAALGLAVSGLLSPPAVLVGAVAGAVLAARLDLGDALPRDAGTIAGSLPPAIGALALAAALANLDRPRARRTPSGSS